MAGIVRCHQPSGKNHGQQIRQNLGCDTLVHGATSQQGVRYAEEQAASQEKAGLGSTSDAVKLAEASTFMGIPSVCGILGANRQGLPAGAEVKGRTAGRLCRTQR